MSVIINMGRLCILTIIFCNTSNREVFSQKKLFLNLRKKESVDIVMKTAVFLAALCFASVTAHRPDPLLRAFRNALPICREKLNLDRDTVRMIKRWEGQGNEKADCGRACIMKEVGLLDGSKFNFDRLDELYATDPHSNPERTERVNQSVKRCQEQAEVSSDDCVVAGRYMTCVDEWSPLHHHHGHHDRHYHHHDSSPDDAGFDDDENDREDP